MNCGFVMQSRLMARTALLVFGTYWSKEAIDWNRWPWSRAAGCRWRSVAGALWRLGYRRGAWWTGAGLGALTVAASVVAGLLGPVAIAVYAVVLSLPVWIGWWWLVRRG